MTADKYEGKIVGLAFGARRHFKARALQRAKIRAEALHGMDRRGPAFRQAKTRLGAEEEDAIALSRQAKVFGVERVEQGFRGFIGHNRLIAAIVRQSIIPA